MTSAPPAVDGADHHALRREAIGTSLSRQRTRRAQSRRDVVLRTDACSPARLLQVLVARGVAERSLMPLTVEVDITWTAETSPPNPALRRPQRSSKPRG
jgi:hypothetical protein